MRLTSQSAWEALTSFAHEAQGFLQANPLLLVFLAGLAVVVFTVTNPRVR